MTETRRSTRQNHLTLAKRVLSVLRERNLKPGDHLPEKAFAEACGVSRTPIRSAFKILSNQGVLEWREEEGYFLATAQETQLSDADRELLALEDSLAQRILSDRAARRIGDIHTVSALSRRYQAPRSAVLNALKILHGDGIVSQMPGRQWVFEPMVDTPNAIDESLNFRLELEPMAILAPGFTLDRKKAGVLRGQMEAMLKSEVGRIGATTFLRLDTGFHGFIADCSGNRFARGALAAHQRLRLATQKDLAIPDFRLRQSLEEHLDILDSLEQMQLDVAADQMRLHLRRSRSRRPDAANRGVMPLMRGPRP